MKQFFNWKHYKRRVICKIIRFIKNVYVTSKRAKRAKKVGYQATLNINECLKPFIKIVSFKIDFFFIK